VILGYLVYAGYVFPDQLYGLQALGFGSSADFLLPLNEVFRVKRS